MSRDNCSCDRFETLEGASVNAYASAFLEDAGEAEPGGTKRLRCRVCGTLWEKLPPDDEAKRARPSLVKVARKN